MNIQPTTNKTLNFKSTYPVVHWVAETNGSYAPAVTLELTKKLQSKLVRTLNKQDGKLDEVAMRVRQYLKDSDKDFRLLSKVRSFYDKYAPYCKKFEPISYMISGKDVALFEERATKDIGKTKSVAKNILGTPYSAESKAALRNYVLQGMEFIKNKVRKIKDSKGMTYSLHTKFEVVRNRNGKIKDYRLLDVRFLPDKGPQNPIERCINN